MKRRAKAIHAELRKESISFDGWLKYEVTIEHPNGDREKVPAYGKDLQDALSRVVHDKKIEKITPVVRKVPSPVWALLWLLSNMVIIYQLSTVDRMLGPWIGFIYVAAIALISTLTLAISNYLSIQNQPK
tara:strand:+ start:131 stop:520 length:390 start_codon:yes stop_codon:yes gene_type:complete